MSGKALPNVCGLNGTQKLVTLLVKIILYADTDRIRESLFREEGSITKIDNVQ